MNVKDRRESGREQSVCRLGLQYVRGLGYVRGPAVRTGTWREEGVCSVVEAGNVTFSMSSSLPHAQASLSRAWFS